MKIRSKILWSFLVFFACLTVAIGFVVVRQTQTVLDRLILSHLETATESRAGQVNLYLNSYRDLIKSTASNGFAFTDLLGAVKDSPDYTNYYNRANQRLKQIVQTTPEVFKVSLLDSSGQVIMSTDPSEIDVTDPAVISALSEQGFYFEDFHVSKLDNRPCIDIAMPIYGDAGQLLGGLVADIGADSLYKLLSSPLGLGQAGEIYLINKDSVVISPLRENHDQDFLKKNIDTQAAEECRQNARESSGSLLSSESGAHRAVGIYRDYREHSVLGAYNVIPSADWCLLGEIDTAEARSPIVDLVMVLGVLLVISLVICVIVAWHLARQMVRPIEKLQRGVEEVERGNLNYRVQVPDQDEIGKLSRSFDSLTFKLKKSRAGVEEKVADQTRQLLNQQQKMEAQQTAMLNVLEDVEAEKNKVAGERDKTDKILHSIGDGVMVVDESERIIIFNHIAEQITGYRAVEALGRPYRQILKLVLERSGEIGGAFIEQAMKEKKITAMTNHTLLIRKDGRSVPVADSAAPLEDEAGRVMGCVVIFRDVSQEREVDRMKTEFVSVASHQLRTPLSAIKWFLEMIIHGDMGRVTKKQMEALQETYNSNERMIHLVNDLLNVSRLESGRIAVDPVLTDLHDLSQSVIKELQPVMQARHQKIIFTVGSDVPQIPIDPKLIRQVLQNLLSNASKYSPSQKNITYTIQKKDSEIVFRIKDEGWGIPYHQQARVFQRFFRADNVISKVPEGTGLGLYVAKEAITVSGGKIGFSSEEGRGSTFWFSLPLEGSAAKKGERSIS